MQNKINIIFENNDVVIIDKYAYIDVLTTLVENIEKKCGSKIFPVTSLDYEATGIVVFAKNEKAYKFISEQFKKEQIKKIYYIIVNGIMENVEGEINKNLLVTGDTTSVNDKGIKSVTKYFVEEQFKNYAFVKVCPLTTRKNQIRAHFWSIGNTLATDKIYGSEEPILLSNLKRRYKGIKKEKPLLKRLPLHLYQMELVLPDKNEKISFTSNLPEDMSLTLKQLRKYNKSRGAAFIM